MKSQKKYIVIALMVAMFLAAVEGTVVTTATPTIVKDLKGFDIISLVFSAYLLTSAISTPIYGKLADLYGRKNTLSIGIIIFLVGSTLCGLSQSMYMLIAFRAVQGLGAGAILTITFTIIGDVFSVEERPKVQGALSTVWGVASLVGPFVGGILIDSLSWHWIFFINIPFGIISIILIQKNLKESIEKKKQKIDFLGIITLSIAMVVFLNIFLSSENIKENKNIFIIVSLIISIVFLIIFYKIEKKVEEPIVPFDIFTKTSTLVNLISCVSSAVLIGTEVYMPVYIQNVLGYSPKISGMSLAPMSIAWFLAAMFLGNLIVKKGGKFVLLISNTIILISAVLMPSLNVHSSIILVLIYVTIMGFGFGGAFTTLTIFIQESVDYNRRGAATATNALLKTLGQTIGVSIFGGLINMNIEKYFNKLNITGVNSSNLYTISTEKSMVTLEHIKLSLTGSIHMVFFTVIGLSAIVLIMTIILPKSLEKDN